MYKSAYKFTLVRLQPTSLSPKGQAIETKCLYLPPIAEIEQAETMIVGKGGYSPNRTVRVKGGEKTYTIVTKKNYSITRSTMSNLIIRC